MKLTLKDFATPTKPFASAFKLCQVLRKLSQPFRKV
jgi:hypothetical protein